MSIPVSVIVPFRKNDEDRQRNILTTLEYYKRFFPDVEVVVAEHSMSSCLNDLTAYSFKHKHVPEGGDGPFNRGKAINAGVMVATHNLLVISDVDLILPPSKLTYAILALQRFDLVNPYNNIAYATKETSVSFLETFNFEMLDPTKGVKAEKIQNVPNLTGGMFLVRKTPFVYVGGFDERFVGWGKEDEAMDHKVRRFMSSTVLPNMIAHLYHPNVDRQPWHNNNKLTMQIARECSQLRDGAFLSYCRQHGIKEGI